MMFGWFSYVKLLICPHSSYVYAMCIVYCCDLFVILGYLCFFFFVIVNTWSISILPFMLVEIHSCSSAVIASLCTCSITLLGMVNSAKENLFLLFLLCRLCNSIRIIPYSSITLQVSFLVYILSSGITMQDHVSFTSCILLNTLPLQNTSTVNWLCRSIQLNGIPSLSCNLLMTSICMNTKPS